MFDIPCPHGQGWLHLLFDLAATGPLIGIASYYIFKEKCYKVLGWFTKDKSTW